MSSATRPGTSPVRPPVPVVLARAGTQVPGVDAMPGGTVYEPKWDGFRVVVFAPTAAGDPVVLQSRHGKDLTGYFPELADAAVEQLPTGAVVDGEVVAWVGNRLDFAALQQRITPSPARARVLAKQMPVSFVAFDVLAGPGGLDVRRQPLRARRLLLEQLAADWRPPLHLTPATGDPATAIEWFTDFPVAGIEGLVAKGAATRYRGGGRDWVKVRARDSLDVVVGAVLGKITAPAALVVGLPGRHRILRIVGRTVAPTSALQRQLAEILTVVGDEEHPWPETVAASVVGDLPGASPPVRLTRVRPHLVVEVAADTAYERGRFRHPLPLRRLRPDLDAGDVRRPGGL